MFVTMLTVIIGLFELAIIVGSAWGASVTNSSFWKIVLFIIAVVFACKIIISAYVCLQSIISRYVFCHKLKRLSRKMGFDYKALHSPIRSFFHSYSGEDIIIQGKDKKYCIKFFPYFTKRKIAHIQDENTVILGKRVALVGNFHFRAFGFGIHENTIEYDPKIIAKKKLDLSFSSDDCEHIILVSPTVSLMTMTENNKRVVLDNAVPFNKTSTIYIQKLLLRHIKGE